MPLLGHKLGYVLFTAAEQVSKALQAKGTTLQEALSTVNLAAAFNGLVEHLGFHFVSGLQHLS